MSFIKIVKMKRLIKGMALLGFSLRAWYYFIRYNFLSKHVVRNNKMKFLWPRRHTVICFEKGSVLELNGNYIIGTQQMRGAHQEARLYVQSGGKYIIGKEGFEQFAGMYVRIMPKGELEINGLVANEGCQITAGEKISIGNGCLFARDVTLRSDDVHIIKEEGYKASKPIYLGNHVWVGQGATILKGVTVGDGAIVASKSLVIKDVPANTLVGGIPAKVIRNEIEWEA